jgi:tRNA (cytidine/uridine-2'-O-)-methyltransferase
MINIILYQPEIPSNTGNILRTSAATGSLVHIIGPTQFTLNDESLKRAGMDYIDMDHIFYYESYEDFLKVHGDKKIHYITRYGHKPCDSFDFSDVSEDYYVMFGKESSGIPRELLADNLDRCIRLPMKPNARSLNLSNCVAIVTYEILRQQKYYGLSSDEAIKGDTYLEDNF